MVYMGSIVVSKVGREKSFYSSTTCGQIIRENREYQFILRAI
jgi:hypothetical protein